MLDVPHGAVASGSDPPSDVDQKIFQAAERLLDSQRQMAEQFREMFLSFVDRLSTSNEACFGWLGSRVLEQQEQIIELRAKVAALEQGFDVRRATKPPKKDGGR